MPKCLVEISGRRIIDYQLDLLKNVEHIRIVVGFMEDQVIDHVRQIRDDVVFVRNPQFQTTSNSYSLYLATRDLREAFFTIDGDLLIDPASFQDFLAACDGTESVIGITDSKTEEAVFVELDDTKKFINAFYRQPRTPYEWCGIACLSGISINKNQGYVYREIERHLPLKARNIKCFEVDTPEDLNYAITHFKP
jgi:choline kinase